MLAATLLVTVLTPFFFVQINKLFAGNWFKRRERQIEPQLGPAE
jgi:hypothetical protein